MHNKKSEKKTWKLSTRLEARFVLGFESKKDDIASAHSTERGARREQERAGGKTWRCLSRVVRGRMHAELMR